MKTRILRMIMIPVGIIMSTPDEMGLTPEAALGYEQLVDIPQPKRLYRS